MNKRILVFFVLASILSFSTLHAQDTESKLIKTLVDKKILTEEEAVGIMLEVDEPEKKSSNKIENAQEFVRKGFNTPYLNFGGYGMLLYQYEDTKKNHHEFGPRIAFLWVDGKINNQLRYFLMSEFVSPCLYEYYAEWMPGKEFNFRAGQFKVPFTLENPLSLTQLEAINNTRSVSSLAGMGTDVGVNKGGGRDIGVQASGLLGRKPEYDLIQYWVGMFQGTGINQKENNTTKDFAGTLAIQPVKGLRVAGGIYAGQAVYKKGNSTELESHVRNRWAISADYQKDRLYARAEWIHGNDGGIKKEGLYGTAMWDFIPKKLNGFARLDHFYNDKDTDEKAMDYMLGTSYFFAPACRFQLNYQYSDYSSNWAGIKNKHSVFAQMQIVF